LEMRCPFTLTNFSTVAAACAVFSDCATTTMSVTPSPQTSVCDSEVSALVLWATQWRPDQKDVPKREAAAEAGLKEFLQTSGCFANSELHRLPSINPSTVAAEVASANGRFNTVVTIMLHELGPVIKLLSSLALVEGGTEVVLQVAEYIPPTEALNRTFTVHWQNGGPGIIRGVASLPQDMQATLIMGLQPSGPLTWSYPNLVDLPLNHASDCNNSTSR
jgi:hypothetical protein